jgi:hypothetical protein
MGDWKQIKVEGVAYIEKCVAEFKIGEMIKTPHAKFKVKVFERKDGTYIGFTNLQLKDETGVPYAGVGFGETIEEALEDTLKYFFEQLNNKQVFSEEDFECVDPYDF